MTEKVRVKTTVDGESEDGGCNGKRSAGQLGMEGVRGHGHMANVDTLRAGSPEMT